MPNFQVQGIVFKHSHSMVQTDNEEIGDLVKPRDALETYRILWDLFRASLKARSALKYAP